MMRLAGFCRLAAAALLAIRPATAQLPPNTHEFDLVFPRSGGVYATQFENDTAALPIILAVQNPDSAYRYGFSFWWDVYQQPHRDDIHNHLPRFRIGASLGNDTTFPDSDAQPHLATAVTEMMDAGNYTFHWRLRTGAWCEYLPNSTVYNSAEYAAEHQLANGSFSFAVEKGAPRATFTGTCPTPLAVPAYASTTVYRGLKWDEENGDPATQTLSCGVMANATVAPQPCSATVDAAQETSISSVMQWGTFATGTARETGAPSSGRVNSVGAWPAVVVLSTAVVWGMT